MIESVDCVLCWIDRTAHRALDASSWLTVLLALGFNSGCLLEPVYLFGWYHLLMRDAKKYKPTEVRGWGGLTLAFDATTVSAFSQGLPVGPPLGLVPVEPRLTGYQSV